VTVPPPPSSNDQSPVVPLATQKQIAFATELGIKLPPNINRREISGLIDAALAEQDAARIKRLEALQNNEFAVRKELRDEILAELDETDPRISKATKEQIMEGLSYRDIGALLVTFDFGVLGGVDDLRGETFDVDMTDDIDEDDMARILINLGGQLAASRNAV